ncbi:hypothetical protein KIPB_014110 [Kipferlia bialata]|uniref:BED-type domain-containing protein n=1 Tax=Kipferlia bialata TaxID=797122 RepID=A0A391P284_9EUKA|nr:hypothetical protein KIPB_014110 [Kipferlia bialata]|eukprot:g14110.t1
MARPLSWKWFHFHKVPTGRKRASGAMIYRGKCKYCEEELSDNTANFRKHLDTKHPGWENGPGTIVPPVAPSTPVSAPVVAQVAPVPVAPVPVAMSSTLVGSEADPVDIEATRGATSVPSQLDAQGVPSLPPEARSQLSLVMSSDRYQHYDLFLDTDIAWYICVW